MSYRSKLLATSALAFAGLAPVAALAQSIGYGSVDGADAGGDEPSSSHSRGHARGGRGGSSLEAYIEAGQIVTAELSPGNEALTYTRVAVGVEVTVAGRNNAASASVRYERRFGYGKSATGTRSAASCAAMPRSCRGPAVRGRRAGGPHQDRAQRCGRAVALRTGDGSPRSIRSMPALAQHPCRRRQGRWPLPDRLHQGRVPRCDRGDPGAVGADIFDKSTVHDAGIHLGTRPGVGLPIGLAPARAITAKISPISISGSRTSRARRYHRALVARLRAGRRRRLRGRRDFEPRRAARRQRHSGDRQWPLRHRQVRPARAGL